jgi:tRNA1(Val) A37 N6-methylase TrmN6
LIPIHPQPGKPAIRLIVRAKKGRRTPPIIRPGFMLTEAETVLRGATPLDPA